MFLHMNIQTAGRNRQLHRERVHEITSAYKRTNRGSVY